jgi:hypothetical protein
MLSPVGLFGKRQCVEMVVDMVHEVRDLRIGKVLAGDGADLAGHVPQRAFVVPCHVSSYRDITPIS